MDNAGDDSRRLTIPQRTVGTLLGREMVDISSGSTLRQMIAKLVYGDVGVIVVRRDAELVGILSERRVMDAGRMMIDRGVRHRLVESPDGDGIVSIRAILRSILS
jgi:CBS domain-containing protein